MYNYTTGAARQVWKERVDGLLDGIMVFFTGDNKDIMTEVACEPVSLCNLDQQSFKAYLSRWMAATTKWAPWTYDRIKPLLESSALAATSTCTGGANGACVGQQMAAMQVVLGNLIKHVSAPVTNGTGGTSIGNASASGSDVGEKDPFSILGTFPPATTADRAGAYVLTVLVLVGVISAIVFMLIDGMDDSTPEDRLPSLRAVVMAEAGRGAGLLRKRRRPDSRVDEGRAIDRSGSDGSLTPEKDIVVKIHNDLHRSAPQSDVSYWSDNMTAREQRLLLITESLSGHLPTADAMESRHFYLLLAVLSSTIVVRVLYEARAHIIGDTQAATWVSPYLLLGVAIIVAGVNISLISRLLFARRADALGCGNVAAYPHKDPILGLDMFIESLHALNSHTLLDLYLKRFSRYGNTYYHIALGRWLLMTNESENIKTILSSRMDDWPIDGPRLFAVLPVLGPKSVFSSNGKEWHAARAMIRPSFVRDQVADLKCFERHVGNLIASIPKDGTTVFDMQNLLLAMTMDSSTDFMLGYSTDTLTRPSPEAQQFLKDFEYAGTEGAKRARLGSLLFYLPHRELGSAVQRLRKYVQFYLRKIVAEKKAGAADRGYDYIVDQIISIIVAGRDTTAAAITAAFWYLARHPEAVEKTRKEIHDLGTKDPSWEQLRQMKYLNNVVREALRLFPPVSTNSRTANKETILPCGGGPDGKQPILVPKGTSVRWSLYCMHRCERVFGRDAQEFRPERWESDLRVGWEYIPFHGGPRICLGQQFALTQIAYTLFRVFSAFKSIEARDNHRILPKLSLTTSFANGCLVSMVPA
ncbi:putative cytochrome P450 protein [Diplogelasinospora grovesii]|uniref:Cytochrome P450 protein n=1 Tax=Diplogelasinospora grovesii TaxID=303347 RepID=A0AAN6S6S7_9PEZI|nr:putative cytochrome P450 protein [Diplogelasinospora grovesii]